MKTTFGAMAIGTRFFDPVSGDDCVKTTERTAELVTGPFPGEDTFLPDEVVETYN